VALTDTQKSQIRLYLGYPDVNRMAHHSLEGAMDAISTEGEDRIGDLLTNLAAIDADLAGSWDRQKVKKAEEVTLAGFDEIGALRSEGRRLAQDLANLLDVPPRRLPFGTSGGGGVCRRGA